MPLARSFFPRTIHYPCTYQRVSVVFKKMWTCALRFTKHLFSCRWSLVGKWTLWLSLVCGQHSSPHSIRRYTIRCWQSALAATTHYGYTAAVVEWADELIGLYVVNGQHKAGEAPHCLAWGMHIVYLHSGVFHHHSTSIWLAYIPACVLSHIRPLWEFNSAVIMMVGSRPPLRSTTPPLEPRLSIRTVGPSFGSAGPLTFPRRASPGSGPQLQLVHFHCDGCMYEYCGISACVLIMLSDCVRQLTAMFSLNKPDFKCWKSSQCTLWCLSWGALSAWTSE